MKDTEIYQGVRKDAMAGAGGSLPVRKVFSLLDDLASIFGDDFSVQHACQALDTLARVAKLAKDELQAAKGKSE